jgi:glycosyltransferase involved in cell wall biosynthesis
VTASSKSIPFSSKPILFVTGHAPPDRIGAFRALHEREGIELALFGGRSLHGAMGSLHGTDPQAKDSLHGTGPQAKEELEGTGAPTVSELDIPHRHVRQRELMGLAASGRYRAVIVSTGGRIALPAAWMGARRARLPVILWASLWAHPRTPAHLLGYPLMRNFYARADAVVTYGTHVSAYVRARGARNVYVAPQAVDNAFWSSPDIAPPSAEQWPVQARFVLMFAGRAAREKGLRVLIEAWRASGLQAPAAALVLVGVGSHPPWTPAGGAVEHARADISKADISAEYAHEGIICLDPVGATQMRNFYAAGDVLVLPSISTRTFREPWGLVVNEAMNRALPVITSDAVGAAAGGLVGDGRNGLIVPERDPAALAHAIRRLADDPALRRRLGEAGKADVAAYTHAAWAQGFAQAIAYVGAARERW